eukprot:COSAG06_NODE_389_length_16410_cov_39.606952_5_plen_511_part_00
MPGTAAPGISAAPRPRLPALLALCLTVGLGPSHFVRSQQCTTCDDVPNTFMQSSDPPKVCATWAWGLENKCGAGGDFASSGSCRASCFAAGSALDASDSCCPETVGVEDDTWFESSDTVTVTVSPPPDSCHSTWVNVATCNPIQDAINSASADGPLVVLINAGTYYNQNYGQAGQQNNPVLVQINNRHHIRLQSASPDVRPKLLFDGSGGISLKTVSYISVRGLEIEGPAASITGCEASLDRLRRTSRSVTGEHSGVCGRDDCSACTAEADCETTSYQCKWTEAADGNGGTCAPKTLAYFSGNGIAVWPGSSNPHHLVFEDLWVHDCPGSGIRVNKGDNSAIRNNLVYDNAHWTVSASSGVVFAESAGIGTNVIANNVVYGNRNFMPFFYYADITSLEGAHEAADGYSTWEQRYIIDGSGVYITRNQNYEGTFYLTDNTCFDNGINGLVVHKTNHDNVAVFVERNHIFDNGRTTRDIGKKNVAPFWYKNDHFTRQARDTNIGKTKKVCCS